MNYTAVSTLPTSALALLLLALTPLSCSSDDKAKNANLPDANTSEVEFDIAALVENLSINVIGPTFARFKEQATTLQSAVVAHCDALVGGDSPVTQTEAESEWKSAMFAWQEAELMLIGPAASSGALRDILYSWPVVSACAVDQEVNNARLSDSSYSIAEALSNRRGLDAQEYALFNESTESVCPPQIQPEGWAELSSPERAQARCEYLEIAVDDLLANAESLVAAWGDLDSGFAAELAQAGKDNSQFETQRDALNALFAGLFYLDKKTKDEKLAKPAGIVLVGSNLSNSCNSESACPEDLESQYASVSKENIEANLLGFRALLLGEGVDLGNTLGFDDYLEARGATELATRLRSALEGADSALLSINSNLRQALNDQLQEVRDVHSALRDITTPLKQEMPSILNLDIPQEAGGDND